MAERVVFVAKKASEAISECTVSKIFMAGACPSSPNRCVLCAHGMCPCCAHITLLILAMTLKSGVHLAKVIPRCIVH